MSSKVRGIAKWVLSVVYVIALLIALSLHLMQNDYAGFIDLLLPLLPPPIHFSPSINKEGEG